MVMHEAYRLLFRPPYLRPPLQRQPRGIDTASGGQRRSQNRDYLTNGNISGATTCRTQFVSRYFNDYNKTLHQHRHIAHQTTVSGYFFHSTATTVETRPSLVPVLRLSATTWSSHVTLADVAGRALPPLAGRW